MNYQNLMFIYIVLTNGLVFIIGICSGSFLNVCAYRIPRGLSIVHGRSFCPSCQHHLRVFDLIPLFSYLFLKGKCRYCGTKISSRYFWVELLTGILFLVNYHIETNRVLFVLNCIAICNLVVMALIDNEFMDIYDFTHYIFLGLAISRFIIVKDLTLMQMIEGAICISFVLLLVSYLSHGGIGMGDVKLMASAGLYLGVASTVLSFVLGVVGASIVAVIMISNKNKHGYDKMPLGPYLGLGVLVAMFYGSVIIDTYLKIVLQ